jgi:hypothetical protein
MPTLPNSVWISADALIEAMKQSGDPDYNLVREHLETAHAYCLGAMDAECTHNLELALRASDSLSGKPLERELKEAIASLLSERGAAGPARWRHVSRSVAPASSVEESPSGKKLAEFFRKAGVSFGIFYPKEYVVAVFDTFEAAIAGHRALSSAGFRTWEAIAVSGPEVETFLAELRANRTVWDELVAQTSRLLDTEVNLVDRYIHWARTGAGFLIAHSQTEADAAGISGLLKPLDPVAMHWFMPAYIRHLLPTG